MDRGPIVTPSARKLIETRLAAIADEHQIKILYACESGSRAWGFPSPDSDYDVRFIYAHPPLWYLTLTEGRDVIDMPMEDSPVGLLDMGGWDLRKTLRLLGKSNPVIWECLQSPVCYQSQPAQAQQFRELRDLFDPFYSPISACHHYLSLCRNTLQHELLDSTVKIKKYFYMLRPLLAAAWIERYRAVPPMEMAHLLSLLDDRPEIKQCILDLQARKLLIDEQIPIQRIGLIDRFLKEELSRIQQAAKALPAVQGDTTRLDRLFRQYLGF